jgi:hypothetical protein
LSAFEVKIAIQKRKSHKSPGRDQIAAEMIKAGCKTIHSDIQNHPTLYFPTDAHNVKKSRVIKTF